MRLQVITNIEDLFHLKEDWDILLTQISSPTPFQTWEWNYSWWKHLSGSKELSVVVMYEGHSLISIMPFWIRDYDGLRILELIGTRGSDYLDLLVSPNHLTSSISSLLKWCLSLNIDLINLEDIPDKSDSVDLLQFNSLKYGMYFTCSILCPCYNIVLPLTWDEYLNALSKRKRGDVLYDRRYIDKHLGEVTYLEEGSNKFAEHVDLHQRRHLSTGHRGSYANLQTINFMADVAQAFDKKGILTLSFLRAEGVPIASIFGAIMSNKKFAITVGFDPAYSTYSPGSMLYGMDIENCINRKLIEYDLSRGHDQYKLSWNAKLKNNLRIIIAKKSSQIGQFLALHAKYTQGLEYAPSAH